MPATITGSQNGTVGLINAATAQNSTSGTSIDFTGIPAGVKRVTVMFNGMSTNGSSGIQIQLGSGSLATTGYSTSCSYASAAGTYNYQSTGFCIDTTNTAIAAMVRSGFYVFTLLGSNTWVGSGSWGSTTAQINVSCSGNSPALSGALDRIRITTANGTDAFDAGSINILYE